MARIKKLVLTLVPERIRPRVRSIHAWLRLLALRVWASTNFLASLHYAFLSRQFGREHRAVLKGRIAYQHSLSKMGQTSALLRRNIHRLEKGLIMRPRRDIFGEEYINETVDFFSRAIRTPGFSPDELKWAKDILDLYFEVVGSTPVIARAKGFYVKAISRESNRCQSSSPRYIPYPQAAAPTTDISYPQLLTLFQRRRSVRWYRERRVLKEDLIRMVTAAAYAPSACNRQPFRFLIADSPDAASAIAKCAGGTGGFADNLQAVVVIVGDLSSYPSERDRHLIYIDASLAVMQMMLSAETLGLSTCPINWPDVESAENKIVRLLPLLEYQRVIMLLAVGYAEPSGGVPYSQKKGITEIVDFVSRAHGAEVFHFNKAPVDLSRCSDLESQKPPQDEASKT